MAKNKKNSGIHLTIGAITLVLTVLAGALFGLSFTTNYYTFGGMNSGLVAVLLGGAIAFTVLFMVLNKKYPGNFWVRFVPFAVIACLAAAAMLLVGDRVEGVGNCIVTDYDSGHGGEEAIYMSFAAVLLMLIAVVYNIIGCFHADGDAPVRKGRSLALSIAAAVLIIAVSVVTIMTTGLLALGGRTVVSDGAGGYSAQLKGTYKVSFNQNNGNLDGLKNYQFLCADFSGIANYDNRLYCDMALTLDGAGGYKLFSEVYCVDAGKRCEIGDDSGLGQVITMNAEGTYVTGDGGTVTTSVPTHAVFEMEMDTYSSQMKEAVGMNVGGETADGVYDSNDHPVVLDFVPETLWTLDGSAITAYGAPAPMGTYTASFNQNNGNLDGLKNYQFLCADFSGIANYDNRLYCDMALTLDGAGGYKLFSEVYCVDAGKRCEIGDDSGLGQVITMNAEGTYAVNGDGTVTTSVPTHAIFEMEMDTYSSQMKEAVGMNVGGETADGLYDSNDNAAVLDFVPETVWTLSGGEIVAYRNASEEAAGTAETEPEAEPEAEAEAEAEAPAEPTANGVTILSDDEGTTMTFNPDGTYRFDFKSYSIVDEGTYTYEGGVLTLTDVNGASYTAEGDPLKLHYGYSGAPDQLTGDYTIPVSTFDFAEAETEAKAATEAPTAQGVTILSDDEGTKMTFNPDGTYRFDFESYSIVDEGTYTYEGGVLTLTDVNGVAYSAEGDPLKLHYGYSGAPDQLTGDYTIPADTFNFAD